jgi:hypothetical protein
MAKGLTLRAKSSQLGEEHLAGSLQVFTWGRRDRWGYLSGHGSMAYKGLPRHGRNRVSRPTVLKPAGVQLAL